MPDEEPDHGRGRGDRYRAERFRYPARDDVPEERQTHEPVNIPDPGTTYRPRHGIAEQIDALDEPESEGGEQ